MGLAGETLHDAAQLLDRAGCLGLLPAVVPVMPGSDGAPDSVVDVVESQDAFAGAALLLACSARADLASCAAAAKQRLNACISLVAVHLLSVSLTCNALFVRVPHRYRAATLSKVLPAA